VTTNDKNRPRSRRHSRGFSTAATAIALLLVASLAAPAASVDVGDHLLAANTPNQVITIQVTGGEQIAGEDFFAQIGDGGTFLGGSNTKPNFTNVEILTGTIFAANNNGAFGDPNGSPPGSNAGHPLIWVDATTTTSGTVAASGVLAKLTIDTTGLTSGTFPLRLTGIAPVLGQFDTTLRGASGAPIPLTVTNGSLTVSIFPLPDYNHNDVVDAADYTVWRDTLGSTTNLAADGDQSGTIDTGDYTVWKSNFGFTAGSGSGANANAGVPEPATLVLLLAGSLALLSCRRTTLS